MHLIPNTPEIEKELLTAIGVNCFEDLLQNIPEKFLKKCRIALPDPLSEIEVSRRLNEIAARNYETARYVSFLGAGSYDHYVPAAVDFLISRSEFYTAYTPYQPEVSQGTLQSIYEYQSMISQLMGLEVANASLYDGATALAEAAIMCAHKTRRKKIVVSSLLQPQSLAVLKTYLQNRELEIEFLPEKEGQTDFSNLKAMLDDQVAGVLVQSPNFLGVIENLKQLAGIVHANRSLLVISANPLSLAILKSPGELGADIGVAEGQPFGLHQSFGGPYLGVFAARKALVRSMPGRIVGETVDVDGKRGYVLVLQTREQHIRREKATSNICTNQGLMALAATIYLALMGKNGLRKAAELCLNKAHYLADRIHQLPHFRQLYRQYPFFNEFVVETPVSANQVVQEGLEHNILAGVALGDFDPKWGNRLLVAVTEKRSRQEMDDFIKFLAKF